MTEKISSSFVDRTAELNLIIRPLGKPKYEIDARFIDLEKILDSYSKNYGGLDMTPDFQRGHVWTPAQQHHYIENVLRGAVSSGGFLVQFNCPNWENDDYDQSASMIACLPMGFQCIDGLQRVTAVRKFLSGDVKPFGLDVHDLDNSSFSMNRGRFSFRLAVHSFDNRSDLLAHYLDLNDGGTQHSGAELARVRGLLAGSVPDSSNAPAAPLDTETSISSRGKRRAP